MSVRLMFSTSTAITPDLLVLDEVLGVGDAYFAHKSYERISELCDRRRHDGAAGDARRLHGRPRVRPHDLAGSRARADGRRRRMS